EYYDLPGQIYETVAILSGAAQIKTIALKIHTPSNLIVFADKSMIATVLRNLISNALKFTRPGGAVEVKVWVSDQQVEVAVCDNGIGMDPSDIGKLFRIDESFIRPGTNKEPGSGLGLILCKDFISKHGGTIRVESQQGIGSCFAFTLPNEIT
ncbi:MAG: HAMP domain-containing histidine kinase, partial [Marinilabiliales bacterium]|nr:HAMP domain-containing histidine kinase [Marinilabiliales bacterium]